MELSLVYLGQLRHIADKESEIRVFPGPSSLAEVLHDLAQAYGPNFARIVLDDAGAVRPSLMVLVNEAPVDKTAPPTLKDGDTLTLLTAISGG